MPGCSRHCRRWPASQPVSYDGQYDHHYQCSREEETISVSGVVPKDSYATTRIVGLLLLPPARRVPRFHALQTDRSRLLLFRRLINLEGGTPSENARLLHFLLLHSPSTKESFMIRINDIARVVPSLQVRRFGLVDDYNHCRRVEGIDDDVMVLASLELEGNSKLVATNVRDAARHK